jgi:hypothetical protein
MAEQVMNLGGDYAVSETSCAFCTVDPFAPVKATCFGIRAGEREPTFGCDACCPHGEAARTIGNPDDVQCAPVGTPIVCSICNVDFAAKWGISYCYGCQTHVCPACVEKAPVLPEMHPKEMHPPAL